MDKILSPPEKKTYLTPKITIYGDVKEITQAATNTGLLDANYQQGTPYGNLFS